MYSKLLLAVRNTLRTGMSLDDRECDIRPTGQPEPACGPKYVAVYGSKWNPHSVPDPNDGIDEEYGVTVAVTVRTGKVPMDRLKEAYIDNTWSCEVLTRQVIALLHKQWAPIAAANTLIDAAVVGDVVGIQEPLRWYDGDPAPRIVSGEWFTGNTDGIKAVGGYVPVGLVMEARFTGARRLQTTAQFLAELGLS